MNKIDYFIKAIQTPIYKDIQWLITLFSFTLFKEDPIPVLYSLRYSENGECSYFDENRNWVALEGNYLNRGLFVFNEAMDLPAGILENAENGITNTTIGRIIQNKLLLAHAFGKKIPYINERFLPKDIENLILKRFSNNPPEGAPRKDNLIYVDEYLKFADSCLFISQLTQVCVPGVTEKALMPPPDIEVVRAKLLEENKEHLDDPAVVAKIGKVLEDIDKEYLKDDRSMGFLINKKKDFGVVRKKMYLTYGFDAGFDEKPTVDYIPQSLSQGIDYKNVDKYINGSRSGSYSRGAETQLGGVAVKELLRASSNAAIVQEDCGSTLGIERHLDEKNINSFLGFSIIENGKTLEITEENKARYIGKKVSMRTPAFCRCPETGFCSKCVGPLLSLHTTGISSAVTAMGSTFMNISMKAMHGKALVTKPLDLDLLIS